jgi:hypothetical protein
MNYIDLRERYMSQRAQAEDQQPWRCAKCGQAVNRGFAFPRCRCTDEMAAAEGLVWNGRKYVEKESIGK